MQPAALSPRWNSTSFAAATTSTSVHHVVTVDSAFLLSHPTLAPFANTTLPPPLLASLPPSSFRVYSRFHVKSVLALMGVKPRHIHRIVAHTFSQLAQMLPSSSNAATTSSIATFTVPLLAGETSFSHSSTVCLSSAAWLSLLRSSLTLSKHYTPSDTPALFAICHSIVSRQQHVLILLAGASGTGKSTLASLLADRMQLSCVIGTDSVRHILRQRVTADACRVLHVSTYQAHQCIADDADVSLLTAPYAQPPVGQQPPPFAAVSSSLPSSAASSSSLSSSTSSASSSLSQAQKVKLGHHQQSLHVCAHLHSLIGSLIASRTSAIVEGAHLLPSFLSYLIATLSSTRTLVLPFLIYISNETKHRERFALRSHPAAINPYILHFPAIRTIQKQLIASADGMDAQHWLPTIDNTNMDRSVAAVHEIVSKVMVREGRQAADGSMQWSGEGRADVLREVDEMRAGAWSSKAMQRVIRMKVEKRHLFDRLREAEWKRREDEGGNEGEDDVKDAASHSSWSQATPQPADFSANALTPSQTGSMLSLFPHALLSSSLSSLSPPSTKTAEQLVAPTQPTAPQPAFPVPSVSDSLSSSAHRTSSIPTRSPPTASWSPLPRTSSLSPSFSPSPNLLPHLSSLPPLFLRHHHQRTARPPSSDDDEYDGKRRGSGGGGAVSESEHSVSVTYSHDVPSLMAPSADDDGDGEVDGSDEERGEEEAGEESHARSIVAIPESEDHAEDAAEADNHVDSDSASDGGYERAVMDDDDRQLGAVDPVGRGGMNDAMDDEGGDADGLVDGLHAIPRSSSGSSSDSGSRRRAVVLY